MTPDSGRVGAGSSRFPGRDSAARPDRLEQIRVLVEQHILGRAGDANEDGSAEADAALIAAHPELMPELREEIRAARLIQRARQARITVDAAAPPTSTDIPISRPAVPAGLDEYIPGYELIREIHRGGQGVVYEAVQHSTKRTVAVKVLLGNVLADERAQWRFEREVKLIAGLKHPHIVVVHDSGVAEGNYFYAMDYVRGEPLDTHVRIAAPGVRDLVRLFICVCDAVAHAHARGIIHRDLKPSNILVGQDGHPYVVDFGLAKVLSDEWKESRGEPVSLAGNLMGTLAYMAPEQTLGDPEAIDTRTDIYALGVMLYRLVTGEHPYEVTGDLSAILKNIREVDPPRPSQRAGSGSAGRPVNSELDAVILKAMEKDPNRRYQSAAELKQDLEAWLEGRPVAAKSASSLYLIRKLASRHRYEALISTCVVFIALGFGSVALYEYGRAQHSREAQKRSDQHAAQANLAASTAVQGELRPLNRLMHLRWFLLQWEYDCLAEARQVQEKVSPDSPEHIAMRFLLDATYPAERLFADMGPDQKPLACFIAGQRAAKSGQHQEAIRYFEQSLGSGRTEWFHALADARLNELRSAGHGPVVPSP